MYLVDALSVLGRRWYVVVVGMLALAGGAAVVVTYVPTVYQSSGQMLLLLPPEASGTEKPVNPYLNLQAGLTTAASLVSGAASTRDVEEEMKGLGMGAEYAVAVVPGTGPLVSVTAKDSDAAMATATRDAMMAWIDTELQRIQEEVDVPRAQYISATRSSVSLTAEALPGSKLRALAALGAVVGILTLALTFGLDRLLARRASSRAGRLVRHPEPNKHGSDGNVVPARAPLAEAGPVPAPAVGADSEAPVAGRSWTSGRGSPALDVVLLDFHPRRAPVPDRRSGKAGTER